MTTFDYTFHIEQNLGN